MLLRFICESVWVIHPKVRFNILRVHLTMINFIWRIRAVASGHFYHFSLDVLSLPPIFIKLWNFLASLAFIVVSEFSHTDLSG